MKLNKRGFAISVILYSMIILVIGILYLLLAILNTRHNLSKEKNNDVVDYINNQGVNTISDERAQKIATNKIINKGNLLYKNGNYYFYGNDPNNYVSFNGETWRIIGVISVNNIKYLKIVRHEPLKEETASNHRLIESNIFTYLNNEYYNTMSDKNMIKSMYWANTEYSTNITAFNAYTEEVKTISNVSNYVGLINGSDFGYAAGESYLTTNLSSYAPSINDNWLALTNDYFTMSFSGTNVNIVSNGNLTSSSSKKAYIYPSVYIKKDIFIIGGEGLVDDPYILSFS